MVFQISMLENCLVRVEGVLNLEAGRTRKELQPPLAPSADGCDPKEIIKIQSCAEAYRTKLRFYNCFRIKFAISSHKMGLREIAYGQTFLQIG